ncbi:MAG: four helix bundle protein [Pyrinomonadaceae bacterium]
MAGFRKFEDILAWQKSRQAVKQIYKETVKGDFSKDYDLRGQIRRASISIMANIAEGFGRNSDKEFANFLNIAHGSAYEVQSHLYIALDLNYITQQTFDEIYTTLEEVCRMLYALRQKLLPT